MFEIAITTGIISGVLIGAALSCIAFIAAVVYCTIERFWL